MFHLVTHAFFKALLFLAAGSIILALHHEQDIWKMGGLRHRMPLTVLTFLVGTLALCGLPPLSGFYSKDSILALALARNKLLFGVGVGTAALTAFYMFRLFFVAMAGPSRSAHAGYAKESPAVVTGPLTVLALGSAAAGFLGIEPLLHRFFTGAHDAQAHGGFVAQALAPFAHAPVAAFAGLAAAVVGLGLAFLIYRKAETDPLPRRLGFVARAMANRFYFDELYAFLIRMTHEAWAAVADWIDRWIVGGLCVRGASGLTGALGQALRLLQTGNLQTYAFLFAAGMAVLLWLVLK